jgi:hypothetical protein
MADTVTGTPVDYYRRLFIESRDLCKEARDESKIDEQFYHGEQLTPAQRRALQRRGQPDTTFNRVRRGVNGTLGVLLQGATMPRAFARNPSDEDAADVASKTLRFICDRLSFKRLRILAARQYLVAGTMSVLIGSDDDGQVTAEHIRWDEFFYDPRSRREDFLDARYMGIAKWVYADTVKRVFPEQVADVDSLLAGNFGLDSTFEDKPRDAAMNWVDKKNARVLLVEIYHNDGTGWQRCVFTGAGILESGASPYLDAKGRPSCAIIAQACYIDGDNDRYGIVRDMRAPQQEINRRRQKLLHHASSRQVQAIPGQDTAALMNYDADLVRSEAARPDGVLPPGWQPVALNDIASGQAALLAHAESEIELQAPNPALLGRQGEGSSGRALITRQQAGLTEQALTFDGVEDWELRVYHAMWDRARQFWKAAAFIRVTDDEKAPEYIGINQPIQGPPAMGIDPRTGLAAIVPTVLGYRNALAEMDVDIQLETTDDSPTFSHEQFLGLLELAKSGVPISPMILLEASSLPNKRKIIEQMQAEQSQPNPAAESAAEAAAAKTDETKARTALFAAKAQTEAMQPEIEAFKLGVHPGQQQPAAGAY